MDIIGYSEKKRIIMDGATGTLLMERGFSPGGGLCCTERPDAVTRIHREYFDAGSDAVLTASFGASGLRFGARELERIAEASVRCARTAAQESLRPGPKWVGLGVGPTGCAASAGYDELKRAHEDFMRRAVRHAPDFIFLETMYDMRELSAAVSAANSCSDLPLLVCCTYRGDGRLASGEGPEEVVRMLEEAGAAAAGVNCCEGPRHAADMALKYLALSSVPVICKPSAGLPTKRGSKSFYGCSPREFASVLSQVVSAGVRFAGGCCGTTPEYIEAAARLSA